MALVGILSTQLLVQELFVDQPAYQHQPDPGTGRHGPYPEAPECCCMLHDTCKPSDKVALVAPARGSPIARSMALATRSPLLVAGGVERGDRVAIVFADNGVETVVAFWAVLKANAVVSIRQPAHQERQARLPAERLPQRVPAHYRAQHPWSGARAQRRAGRAWYLASKPDRRRHAELLKLRLPATGRLASAKLDDRPGSWQASSTPRAPPATRRA